MRKKFLALLLAVLVFSRLAGTAWADNTTYITLPEVTAGQSLGDNVLLCTCGVDETVKVENLPDGCSVEEVLREIPLLKDCYLRGTPAQSGVYSFDMTLTSWRGIDTLSLSMTVQPSQPQITGPESCDVSVGAPATLTVLATAADSGSLSYSWFACDANGDSRTPVGTDQPLLSVSTEAAGTFYYGCTVTNTGNDGLTASTDSAIAAVQVSVATVTSVSVYSYPKTEYTVGAPVDLTGLQLKVFYSDGTSSILQDITEVTCSPQTLNTVGTVQVELTYAGCTCTFPVQVNQAEEKVTGIVLVSGPYKLEYLPGETLKTDGMVLRLLTESGARDITTGFFCSPSTFTTAGQYTVTVYYDSFHTDFTVTVTGGEKTAQGIFVEVMPSQLSYTVGDSMNVSGMVLGVNKSDGTVEEVVSGYSFQPTRLDTPGSQKITVTYGELSTYFYVTVEQETTDTAAEPTPTPAQEETAEESSQPAEDTDAREGTENAGKKDNSGVIAVVFIAAVAALAGLGVYAFIMGHEEIRQTIARWLEQHRK